MGVKFLSAEWLSEVEQRLNAHAGFQKAAAGQTAKIQQEVTESSSGTVRYGFSLEDGKAQLTVGDVEAPDATVSQSYDTAAALAKGELKGPEAFMSGRLKISGNMMKLMTLQPVLMAMPEAVSGLDVDY